MSLALKWCVNLKGTATCLTSQTNCELLKENLKAVTEEMTKEEDELIQEMDEKFFRYLTVSQWENQEVIKYWNQMTSEGIKQNLD